MTIAATSQITIRPWRGYDDPGLPVGMWYAQNSVTGDASAGNMVVIFVFKGEAEPISGRFFNLEQINIFLTATGAALGVALLMNNFETTLAVGLVNQQWRMEVEDNTNEVRAMTDQLYLPLPLFLGAVAPVASLSAQMEVSMANVDLASLVVTAQGYIWEARSIQAEGGLRRPVDSLYGR